MSLEFSKLCSYREVALDKSVEVVRVDVAVAADVDISRVIAACVKPQVSRVICEQGSATYQVEAKIDLVFADSTGNVGAVCSSGSFSGKIISPKIAADSLVLVDVCVTETETEKVGAGGVTLSVAYEAAARACVSEEFETLTSATSEYLETEKLQCGKLCARACADFSLSHEFECKGAVACALVSDCRVEDGEINTGDGIAELTGKAVGSIVFKTEEGEILCERFSSPFTEEVALRGASVGDLAIARFSAVCEKTEVFVDEVKETSRFSVSVKLRADIRALCFYEAEGASEVFSNERELYQNVTDFSCDKYIGTVRAKEELSENATTDFEIEKAICVICKKACVSAVEKEDGGAVVTGNASVDALVLTENGLVSFPCTLPFRSYFAEIAESAALYATAEAESASVSLRYKNEISLSITLRTELDVFESTVCPVITSVEFGEEKAAEDGEIIIFVASGGETPLKVARELNVSPSEITGQNPEVSFPLDEGEKLVVYRKKS